MPYCRLSNGIDFCLCAYTHIEISFRWFGISSLFVSISVSFIPLFRCSLSPSPFLPFSPSPLSLPDLPLLNNQKDKYPILVAFFIEYQNLSVLKNLPKFTEHTFYESLFCPIDSKCWLRKGEMLYLKCRQAYTLAFCNIKYIKQNIIMYIWVTVINTMPMDSIM